MSRAPIDILLGQAQFKCLACGRPMDDSACRCWIWGRCECGWRRAIRRAESSLPDAVERVDLLSCPTCSDTCVEVWRDKDGNVVEQFDENGRYLGDRR